MKVWAKKDCVAAGAQLKEGKEYDLPPAIANKLIARGLASEKMPTTAKAKKEEEKAE